VDMWKFLMKVDVEGAELEMFKGAAAFFEKVHPLLFMEIHNSARVPLIGGDIGQLERKVKEYSYDLRSTESRVVLE
ncbi:MAG: FkbM family methyltransferase, partial [Dehalococcoidia bacterium]